MTHALRRKQAFRKSADESVPLWKVFVQYVSWGYQAGVAIAVVVEFNPRLFCVLDQIIVFNSWKHVKSFRSALKVSPCEAVFLT